MIDKNNYDRFTKTLLAEIKNICRQGNSSLQKVSLDDITEIDWSSIIAEWEESAPLFLSTMRAIIVKLENTKSNYSVVAFLGSCFLFAHSQKISQLQHSIGLLLDFSDTTNEVSIMDNSYKVAIIVM